MNTHNPQSVRLIDGSRQAPIVQSSVMGMLIFVVVEVMFFAGLISAFTIVRAGAAVWPPRDQPRLPLEATAVVEATRILR